MKLGELFVRKAIVADLESDDKKGALRELAEAARSAHGLRVPVADVVDAIVAREKLGSTGIGHGVAIPHVKSAAVKSVVGAFGRSVHGLDFSAVDGEPVHLVFMIIGNAAKPEEHMEAVRCVAAAVRRPNFCKFARNARGVKDIEELFAEVDEGARP